MLTRTLCLSALLVAGSSMFAAPAPSDGYAITKKIAIPGEGSWDYLTVDESARRLYVSHGTQVEVVDVDSESVVGSIPKTPGVHGIALAPELGRGFVSNGQASTVTIFDLKTLKPIGDVPTGKKPDAIIFDPATSRVSPLTAAATVRRPSTPLPARSRAQSISAVVPSSPPPTAKASSTTIWKMRASF